MSNVDQFVELMLGYSQDRLTLLTDKKLKVAHYTTAEKAMLILQSKELWLRSASVMNDSKEVLHGLGIMETVLKPGSDLAKQFIEIVDTVQGGIGQAIIDRVFDFRNQPIEHTYIISLAEYRPDDKRGLLSMWRAYGGSIASAALVFHPTFASGPGELNCYGSPVFYGDHDLFIVEFQKLLDRMKRHIALMNEVGPKIVQHVVYFALEAAILSMKHEGFCEEEEWRIVHRPFTGFGSAWVEPAVKSIWGVPQTVYRLPLENKPGMSMPMLDLKNLLYCVIVGPSLHPDAVKLGFVQQLLDLGFEKDDAYSRVIVSDIPLRRTN